MNSLTLNKIRKLCLCGAAVVALLVMATLLSGCGGSKVESSGTFEHKTVRNISEISDYYDKAIAEIEKASSEELSNEEYTKKMNELASKFNEANERYRNGEYAKAQSSYVAIIKEHSEHYGANNNLTLALLQQNNNDEALQQAIVAYLRSLDTETLINLQVAMVACGFSASDLSKCSFVESSDADNLTSSAAKSNNQELRNSYNFNIWWDEIETTLDQCTDSNKQEMKTAYESLKKKIGASNKDEKALRDYLNACAYSLGIIDQAEYQKLIE